MRSKNVYIVVLFASVLLAGCTASKKTSEVKVDENILKLNDANLAFNAGDYQKALISYEEIIDLKRSQNKKVDSTIYQNAGLASYELKQTDKTIQYLELAKRYSVADEKTYSILAKVFLEKDNLSKEITNLDAYINKYPQGKDIQSIYKQLFNAYVKSENWDLAFTTWSSLDASAQGELQYLTSYYKVNKKLEKKNQLEKIAQQILRLDANNVEALELFAEKHYYLAENSYIKEMNAYQKNKTEKQYQQLLAAFKILNENYKIAQNYFLKLYKIEPKSRYATFLGNIYTRFENKEKADYYYNLAKKKQ